MQVSELICGRFAAGDLLGYVLAWFSLLPIFLLVSFLTLVVVRRDLQTVREWERRDWEGELEGRRRKRLEVGDIVLHCLCSQIFFLAGIVLNEGWSFVLKHIIREPRPSTGT